MQRLPFNLSIDPAVTKSSYVQSQARRLAALAKKAKRMSSVDNMETQFEAWA